jgi:hypothetical protein
MQTDGFLKFAAPRPDKQPNAAPNEYLTIRDAWRRMSLKGQPLRKKVSKPADKAAAIRE